MSLYRLHNLVKRFGSRNVVDIDDLSVDAGKVYTLLGPNGAGKTTLLNMLAFLDCPTRGTMEFLGDPVPLNLKKLAPFRKQVVVVDQYPILFTGPVWKSVEFGLRVRKVAKKERILRVKEALDLVGMENYFYSQAQRLSGGETKRVALARALAIEPKVMLCDEPTANVDTENQEIILTILERINREKKVSLIFATHYLSQAQRLADHTLVLQGGRLVESSRQNIFVAHRVSGGRGKSYWKVGETLELVAAGKYNLLPEKSRIFLDPAQIQLVPLDIVNGDSKQNFWKGRVQKIELQRDTIMVTVDCGILVEAIVDKEQYERKKLFIDQKVGFTVTVNEKTFVSD